MWSEVGGVQAFYAVILSEIEGCYKQVKNDNLRIADDLKHCMKCRVLIVGCFDIAQHDTLNCYPDRA